MASPEAVAWMTAVFDEVWPRQAASDKGMEVYLFVLKDIPDADLRLAVEQLVASATFRPVPAEVRTTALSMRMSALPSAYEAWAEVKRHLQAGHARDEWQPLTLQALRGIGGFEAFGMSDRADESYWLNQFVKSYEVLAQRTREEARMLPEVRERRQLAQSAAQLEAGG